MGEDGVDGDLLIGARRIGEAPGNALIRCAGRDGWRGGLGTGVGQGGEAFGGSVDFGLQLGPCALPRIAAEAIGRHAGVGGAQAPDAVEIPGFDEQVGAGGIIERHPLLILQAHEAAQSCHAVIGMHDEIAGPQRILHR